METRFTIQVVYNGVTEPLQVQPHEQVRAALQQAIHLFHITQNPHLLSFFRTDGSEVPDNQSVGDAGIKPGELLALRPSAVKGGEVVATTGASPKCHFPGAVGVWEGAV